MSPARDERTGSHFAGFLPPLRRLVGVVGRYPSGESLGYFRASLTGLPKQCITPDSSWPKPGKSIAATPTATTALMARSSSRTTKAAPPGSGSTCRSSPAIPTSRLAEEGVGRRLSVNRRWTCASVPAKDGQVLCKRIAAGKPVSIWKVARSWVILIVSLGAIVGFFALVGSPEAPGVEPEQDNGLQAFLFAAGACLIVVGFVGYWIVLATNCFLSDFSRPIWNEMRSLASAAWTQRARRR